MEYKIDINKLEWKSGQVKGFSGKEFLQLNNGSVKMVKIDPLAFYPIHVHPDKTEYAFVVTGNPEFLIEEETYLAKPSDFFIFPNNIKHAIKNNTAVECYLLIGSIKI
jgi:quercetin dioxygenase-like cupin family protein